MSAAYVLIVCEEGTAGDVATLADAVDAVIDATTVLGPYDVVCRIEGNDLNHVATLVVSQLQSIDGVVRTDTLAVSQPAMAAT